MVQKGKFSAGIANFVRVLKSVDLPTFGNPTMPILRWEENLPRIDRSAGGFLRFGGFRRHFRLGTEATVASRASGEPEVNSGGLERRLASQRSAAVASRASGGGVEQRRRTGEDRTVNLKVSYVKVKVNFALTGPVPVPLQVPGSGSQKRGTGNRNRNRNRAHP